MGKKLVAYFSVSGVTAKVSVRLAEAVGAGLYEIRPEIPYTNADLDWYNKKSRSSIEMDDKSCRPQMADQSADVAEAEVVYVGFPIWWYREPSIIDTFLEAYDFSGKKIVPFCTSGGSEIGDTAKRMQEIVRNGVVLEGKRFSSNVSVNELKAWADSLAL